MATPREGGDGMKSIQFTGNFDECEEFVGGDAEFRNGALLIATQQGPLVVQNNHWIVNRKGKFTTQPTQPPEKGCE